MSGTPDRLQNPAQTRGFAISGLGEIAIRCIDFAAMTAFYRDTLGLELLADRGGIIFFKLGNGVEGHTAVLALFNPEINPGCGASVAASSTLHHVALSLSQADQQAACRWFEANGISYKIEEFSWIGWRGVFLTDPDGNTVELVSANWPVKD
ncbi:lactoylglutathione lyase-like lyase [Hoeflea sp. IMCC20628]|uniref:VOC family protein n=1 Tax=Hoeflea sp. IMCC20628 TaxID=1620421 RepID=UPI00063AE01A|nr:VOC family protein [Hoeflea sp. IMCC20628]AKI00268.1 lactoylglutathione lyase-like lyase [Hoeflea sp. IMCC20628]